MANTEKAAPTKLFFSPTKFAPGIDHGDKAIETKSTTSKAPNLNTENKDATTFTNSSDYAGNKSAYKPKSQMNIKSAGTQPHYRSGGGFGKSKTPKLSTTSTTTSNTYKPFKMKFQGGNAIHGNFPESFKLSYATKPSTSQNPSGPPFIKALTGLLGKKEESPNDYKSPNKGIVDIVSKGVETFNKVKKKVKPIVDTVKKVFTKKSDKNGDENTTASNRPKVSEGKAGSSVAYRSPAKHTKIGFVPIPGHPEHHDVISKVKKKEKGKDKRNIKTKK